MARRGRRWVGWVGWVGWAAWAGWVGGLGGFGGVGRLSGVGGGGEVAFSLKSSGASMFHRWPTLGTISTLAAEPRQRAASDVALAML